MLIKETLKVPNLVIFLGVIFILNKTNCPCGIVEPMLFKFKPANKVTCFLKYHQNLNNV